MNRTLLASSDIEACVEGDGNRLSLPHVLGIRLSIFTYEGCHYVSYPTVSEIHFREQSLRWHNVIAAARNQTRLEWLKPRLRLVR